MSSDPTVASVCFRVDGGWLADFARTRLEEGAWDRALQLLVDSLDGLTSDQAVAILKGEATLTGCSSDPDGIGYEELPADGPLATRMRERLDFMYGDLFRVGDTVWRPYAVVSGWCEADFKFAVRFKGPWVQRGVAAVDPSDKSRIGVLRSLCYAKDPRRDMLVRVPERLYGDRVIADVLCEEHRGGVPFWYRVSTNDMVAFLERRLDRGLGGLELRGATHDDPLPTARDEPPSPVASALASTAADAERVPAATELVPADQRMRENDGRRLFLELLESGEAFFSTTVTDYAQLREMDALFERAVDRLHRFSKDNDWDRVEALRAQFEAERERLLGEAVRTQAEAHGGFIELPLTEPGPDGEDRPYAARPTLTVPKHPFLHWCLRFIRFEAHGHETPTWAPVAPMGMKMGGDNPFHTDWMLGAGVPLASTYDRTDGSFGKVVMHSAYRRRDQVVREYTGHQFTVLARGVQTRFSGEVEFPGPNERVAPGTIAVVPHAGPEYQAAMETANMEDRFGRRGCIICEVGGKLAHLVVVGREFKCTVLMLPGVMGMYLRGQRVIVDTEAGVIESVPL